jgi:formylglycine-generating enzyme required for sulfatase activity
LDRFLLEDIGVRGMVRYMDDAVWWCGDGKQGSSPGRTLGPASAFGEGKVSAPGRGIAWAPDRASGWGEDEHGLFADLRYGKVVQRMRWIAPGRFTMGSPEEESGRDTDEDLHEVELTEGCWLGDTACTQELWAVVMGKNLREGGSSRPVEQVSWDDCQAFLDKLNGEVPGLDLRLPTEAEWEYACRAGTTTAYSLGPTITQKQVNFGYGRKTTVPVKSLPANPWGLYEMHGNIWEWCLDEFAPYEPGSAKDPVRLGEGHDVRYRVLRGGSWFNGAWYVRSAFRFWHAPASRNDGGGFRVARGRPIRQAKPVEGARGPVEASGASPTKGPRATEDE